MEHAARAIERNARWLAHETFAIAAAYATALDDAVARVTPWLEPQQRHYLVGGTAVFTALVGVISILFVWIASRQVRPRKLPPASSRAQMPLSPTSKRKRHSKSFTDLLALERGRLEENAVLDRHDQFEFPPALHDKCRSEDLKLIYDMLSKVFSFLKGESVETLAQDLQIHELNYGDEIFARGAHDGSILFVVQGTVALTIHSNSNSYTSSSDADAQFTKTVRRGETFASSLSLLTALLQDDDAAIAAAAVAVALPSASLLDKVCGSLSATAASDHTTVFQVPLATVARIVQPHPDRLFRLAQTAFSQVEKITAKSLMHHFGLYSRILTPSPLVNSVVKLLDNESDSNSAASRTHSVAAVVADAIGLQDADLCAELAAAAQLITCTAHDIVRSPSSPRSPPRSPIRSAASFTSTAPSTAAAVATGVFVVVEGAVTVQVQTPHGTFVDMYTAPIGCEVGVAASVVGSHAVTRIVCTDAPCRLLWIPDALFARLLQVDTVVTTRIARHLVQQYAPLVCVTDSSFDWLHLHGGESLFDCGDACNSVFTVISGRLRAVQTHTHRGKQVETTSEVGRGATLGAMDMLAAGRSHSSVFAIRDSQIAQMSRNVFDFVVADDPKVLVHFTTNLANHMHPSGSTAPGSSPLSSRSSTSSTATSSSSASMSQSYLLSLSDATESPSHSSRSTHRESPLPLGTIAVLSLTRTTKIETFCDALLPALSTLATTSVVSADKAAASLGEHWIATSRVARAKLSTWLGEIESAHELVIYEADAALTPWTQLCVRQADHILLLSSDAQPEHAHLSEIARTLQAAFAQKSVAISVVRIREENWTLAALADAAKAAASDASKTHALKKKLRLGQKQKMLPKFLLPMEKYEWISGCHNVQVPFDAHTPDFLRLCRRITGNAVGVVLGGGGARGLAHIGVLRALSECGIHVDVVGGTSIGAFIGAAYALHPHDLGRVQQTIHTLSQSLSSVTEKLRDLTLPIASFFHGRRFNDSIQSHFYDLAIEDLVLNYFCVSTDIAKSRMNVHESGVVWKAVRASMTLQGYLPPISEDGSVLVDGGYMNNLPADVMKDEGGIKFIVAVDVGSEPRREYFSYGSSLSGWWLLWNKLNPFSETVSVPSMGDVSAALAYVSSEQHKDRMKTECIDLYLRPPVNDYGTLQFDKMDEIIDVGYRYALPRIRKWAKQVLANEPDADIVEPVAKEARRL